MRSEDPEEMVRTLAGTSDSTTEHFLP
jgi:hypothetical protein